MGYGIFWNKKPRTRIQEMKIAMSEIKKRKERKEKIPSYEGY